MSRILDLRRAIAARAPFELVLKSQSIEIDPHPSAAGRTDRLVVDPKPTFPNPTDLLALQNRSWRERCQKLGASRRVLAGFSRHGFEFGAVIGEAIAAALSGQRPAAAITASAAGQDRAAAT